MWVFDATPLIYLAKVEQLYVLSHLSGRCRVPEPVYEEVVPAGLEAGYSDAHRIEQGIEDGALEVVPVKETPLTDRLRENPTLSDADIAVLGCAAAIDATAVMDEAAGRRAAAVEDIQTRGTAYLVLQCAKRGRISVTTARETIDAMIDAGWYCAPNLYAKLVRKLESFEE
ncbi:DUF3368 domain protein [Natrialba magadii ATCC 43099]|uniref:DUF3368 domain protein n=1 Tax=Natrialba magadii (strain ATCC 43099 / DSM 3394 / CCM 3739 / CIP 104546 / IAM 13178 / JCM 8861 / NBRC 102185 / NCIMB 2190 / MS3) TaxID=547559 RepID=D3SV69_NATMM|nr:DUF3368 domain-containing protein [Natrialba magadii]ADD05477.1 DUF3368 domain protein [Natrialba magadii ATCC 43099]ELY29216.1 hypothetical protein C500_10870 [Natrialba magadii ATCC 43099]